MEDSETPKEWPRKAQGHCSRQCRDLGCLSATAPYSPQPPCLASPVELGSCSMHSESLWKPPEQHIARTRYYSWLPPWHRARSEVSPWREPPLSPGTETGGRGFRWHCWGRGAASAAGASPHLRPGELSAMRDAGSRLTLLAVQSACHDVIPRSPPSRAGHTCFFPHPGLSRTQQPHRPPSERLPAAEAGAPLLLHACGKHLLSQPCMQRLNAGGTSWLPVHPSDPAPLTARWADWVSSPPAPNQLLGLRCSMLSACTHSCHSCAHSPSGAEATPSYVYQRRCKELLLTTGNPCTPATWLFCLHVWTEVPKHMAANAVVDNWRAEFSEEPEGTLYNPVSEHVV